MRILIIVGIVGIVLAIVGWFFFLRAPAEVNLDTSGELFQTGGTQTMGVSGGNTTTSTNTTEDATNTQNPIQLSNQKVFKINNGPVVGATVIQTLRPTTTVARYVQQNNGHVFDVALDSSGAIPKAISNTTIPGIVRALWADGGNSVLLQYLEGSLVKTVYLGFPVGQSTTTRPVTIRFLPDGIQDIAVSPDGLSVVYLLRSSSGVVGYTAKPDGMGGKQLFTIPLSEIVISWPAKNTLLAHSKSGLGTPGMAFSINASSGAVTPTLYASSLTLTANPTFSHIVYQSTVGEFLSTYARNNITGKTSSLSYDPYPEKCIWGTATSTYLYCAAPLEYVETSYLDRWHQGAASVSDAILWFNVATGEEDIIASPGSDEGGVESAVHTMTISADNKYLLFVRRGDYSLWGVRLED